MGIGIGIGVGVGVGIGNQVESVLTQNRTFGTDVITQKNHGGSMK